MVIWTGTAGLNRGIGALALLGLLAACGDREVILEGQRFGLRVPLEASAGAETGATVALPPELSGERVNESRPVSLPAPVANADWTHRAGSPSHLMPHLALSAAPQRVWTANIGAGDSRRQKITAAPVVAGGRIFVMDAANQVSAVSTTGEVLWSADATLPGERAQSASGGGLGYGEGRLFVTTGFGELIALDPATGAVQWRQRFEAPVTGAPTVAGGMVYISARDSGGWAISAADGRQRWVLSGVPSSSGRAAPAAPAVAGDTVYFPFGSGEIVAATAARGEERWTGAVAGRRPGRAVAFIGDITGDPVVAGGVVYAGSAAGRTVALRTDTGQEVWSAPEGAYGPVAVAGGSVFLVSDEARLVRLDAASGAPVWSVGMPLYDRDNPRRQVGIHAHFGPILAGGRLVVVSDDRLIRLFAPENGALAGTVELPSGAAAAPALAGGTLYVVTGNGQLHAFR